MGLPLVAPQAGEALLALLQGSCARVRVAKRFFILSLIGWFGGRTDVLLDHALLAVGNILDFAVVLSDLVSRKTRPTNVIVLLDTLDPTFLGRKSRCRRHPRGLSQRELSLAALVPIAGHCRHPSSNNGSGA